MTRGRAGGVAARATARRAIAGALLASLGAVGAHAQQPGATPVEVQMRHVDFRVDSTVVLRIGWLRGRLERTAADAPPYFDDKRSFALAIDTARIALTAGSLSALLNHHVFAYRGSPLRGLTVSLARGRLYLHGRLRGIGFTIESEPSLTSAGEIRLHPASIKVAGLSVGGLLKLFGIELQKLVDLDRAPGVRLEGSDFVLSPTKLLPPPAIRGRLGAIEVLDTAIVQVFVPMGESRARPVTPPEPAENYMYFRRGTLRFGKLTMEDADLEIVDVEPRDPFDFFLDRYNLQLVAGYSRNTPEHGLVVMMPDFSRAREALRRGGVRPDGAPR